jgi:heme/copper-type cytochrome/quinol oxidase subunit 2
MKIKITVVDNQAQYETWLAQQATVVAPVEAPAVEADPASDTTSQATPSVALN